MTTEIKTNGITSPNTEIDLGVDLNTALNPRDDFRAAGLREDASKAVAEEFGAGPVARRGSVIIARGEQPDGANRPITGLYPAGNAPDETNVSVANPITRGAVRLFQDSEFATAA